MGKRVLLGAVVVLFSIGILTASADAALVWNWSFDVHDYYVGPDETVYLNATLYNDPSSTVDLVRSHLTTMSESHNTAYDLYKGPGPGSDFWTQFTGLSLQPGESFQFVLGRLVPKYLLPIGFTATGSGTISVNFSQFKSDTYTINVQNQTVIPEPVSLVLFGIGAAGFGMVKRRKQLY